MSEINASRRPRADAALNREAVLDAAVRLLDRDRDASMQALAAAAGVTRQTVYAHFASREDLVAAALDRITEEAVAAMDAAGLDEGPAAEALVRLIEAGSETVQRHPGFSGVAVDEGAEDERHSQVTDRLMRVIRRGQDSGEFDAEADPGWLAVAVIALGHAAGREFAAGRVEPERSKAMLRVSVLRVLGCGTVTSTS